MNRCLCIFFMYDIRTKITADLPESIDVVDTYTYIIYLHYARFYNKRVSERENTPIANKM